MAVLQKPPLLCVVDILHHNPNRPKMSSKT